MLNIEDWELLGSQSETRMDDWVESYMLNYRRFYGDTPSGDEIHTRYEEVLANPIFINIAYLQEFWMRLHWIVRYRLFHFWSQDLNDDKRHLLHGRSRIYFTLNDQHKIDTLQCLKLYFSWTIPGSSFSSEVAVGGEDRAVMLHLSLFLFSVWIALEGILPSKLAQKIARYDHERYTGVKFHHGSLWLSFWHDEMGYQDWRGWHKVIHVVDILFGESEQTKQNLAIVNTIIQINGTEQYEGTLTLYQSIWKRKRFPGSKRVKFCRIEMTTPIPIPGKGENDWDCEDDAISEMTLPAESFIDAIKEFITSIEKTRQRYGGNDWRPTKQVS